jgi:hypothetical protein
LRDEYPSIHIISIAVAGFRGDTPLQYYNTVFSIQVSTITVSYIDALY